MKRRKTMTNRGKCIIGGILEIEQGNKMKDKKWWRTKGFFESGATLIRDGDTDRTFEEVKHLLTIPELKLIKVTKNDIVEQD